MKLTICAILTLVGLAFAPDPAHAGANCWKADEGIYECTTGITGVSVIVIHVHEGGAYVELVYGSTRLLSRDARQVTPELLSIAEQLGIGGCLTLDVSNAFRDQYEEQGWIYSEDHVMRKCH
jgi:hypothetical protein